MDRVSRRSCCWIGMGTECRTDGEEEEEDEEVLIERAEAFLAMDDDEFRAPSTTS